MNMMKLRRIGGKISKHERLLQWTNLQHIILDT
jgi:hypothetical protein